MLIQLCELDNDRQNRISNIDFDVPRSLAVASQS